MKKKWIAVVIASVVAVAAAAAFGGYAFGVKAGQAKAAEIRASFLAERGLAGGQPGASIPGQGGLGAAGAPGQGASSRAGSGFDPANVAMGQVKQVDGDTVQLSTAYEVLTVKVGDQTQIRKMADGSLSDLQAGERITVQGTRGSDGTMAAQSIQIGGPGGGGPLPAGTPAAAAAQ